MHKKKKVEYVDDPIGVSLDKDWENSEGRPWIETIPEKEYDPNSEHPTVEQMFIRQAIKYLTAKQRAIWEYHNYDRLTQDEIAEKLHISQQAVQAHIHRIEKRIAKWCKSNMGAYKLLKTEYGQND